MIIKRYLTSHQGDFLKASPEPSFGVALGVHNFFTYPHIFQKVTKMFIILKSCSHDYLNKSFKNLTVILISFDFLDLICVKMSSFQIIFVWIPM